MFKTLCIFLIFAVVVNANVYSASSNTGLNQWSSGSSVNQNNIQNAQSWGGYGVPHPYPYYPGYYPGYWPGHGYGPRPLYW